jgi:hypothetical protein
MALATVRRSDLSGQVTPNRTGARVRVMFNDVTKPDRRADLTDEEVERLLGFAPEVETRPERRGGAGSRFAFDGHGSLRSASHTS